MYGSGLPQVVGEPHSKLEPAGMNPSESSTWNVLPSGWPTTVVVIPLTVTSVPAVRLGGRLLLVAYTVVPTAPAVPVIGNCWTGHSGHSPKSNGSPSPSLLTLSVNVTSPLGNVATYNGWPVTAPPTRAMSIRSTCGSVLPATVISIACRCGK